MRFKYLAGFARHPQTVRLRRILLQIHLWTGLLTALYILIISLSGSLIVFRRELDHALCPPTAVIGPSGRRFMALCEPAFISWLAEFHDHLSAGRTGLLVNGIGAMVVALMCVSGLILWWPGTTRWRRSLTLHRGVAARRFIRDLHNVLGFWLCPLILMWSVTSLYFAFPDAFNRIGDDVIAWLVRLHFGRTYGPSIEALWVALGLAPAGLAVTGALMWWHRTRAPVRSPAAGPPPS